MTRPPRRRWTVKDLVALAELAGRGMPTSLIAECLDPPSTARRCQQVARYYGIAIRRGTGRTTWAETEHFRAVAAQWRAAHRT